MLVEHEFLFWMNCTKLRRSVLSDSEKLLSFLSFDMRSTEGKKFGEDFKDYEAINFITKYGWISKIVNQNAMDSSN